MKPHPGHLLTLAALLVGCASPSHYGESMKLQEGDTLELETVLEAPATYDGRFVRISGEVVDVCRKKGCWIRIGGEGIEEPIFVKFTCPIDGRLIPIEAVGASVVVEGTLVVSEMSQAEARHYAEDGGATPEEIEAIVGPREIVRMNSPAARVD